MIAPNEQEQGSLFSSPAFGSFASPRIDAKGASKPRASSSSSGSDLSDGDNEGAGGASSGRRKGRSCAWQREFDAFLLDEERDAVDNEDSDSATDCLHSPQQRQQQHEQQRLLLRFSCADSLDSTSRSSCNELL
jgi:hypothetical protein